MKRLTKSNPSGSVSFIMCGKTIPTIMTTSIDMQVVLDRLAAYEDTGLEPEQIGKAMEDCADTVSKAQFVISEINEMGDIDHIWNLVQAEKNGRLIVLPCRKGSPLFALTPYSPDGFEETKCKKIIIFNRGGKAVPKVTAKCVFDDWGDAVWEFWPEDFGKVVFLTREEAEAALKKSEEADNETD